MAASRSRSGSAGVLEDELPLELPQSESFGNVLQGDMFLTGEVGNRACHAPHPLMGARGHAEAIRCLLEQLPRLYRHRAHLLDEIV